MCIRDRHSTTRTSQIPVKEMIIGVYLWPAARMVPLKILDKFCGIWAKPIINTYFMPDVYKRQPQKR